MPIKSRTNPGEYLFVGIKGSVVALRKDDGGIAWEVRLSRGMTFVPLVQEGDRLFAASGGEVTCLDCATGKVLWRNQLKGYGIGYVALAGAGFPTSAVASIEAAQAAAAAG